MQVLGTLLPPAAPPPAGASPAPSAAPAGGPATALNNDLQQIVILAVTPQQSEVIRYGQQMANPLLTLSLILRSPDDFIDPVTKQPVTPPLDETTGIVLRTLIDTYGVLPPTIARAGAADTPAGPLTASTRKPSTVTAAGDGRSTPPPTRSTTRTNQSEMADQIRVLVVDDIPETRDHLTKLLGFESDIDVVGAAASGREAVEMAVRLSPDVVLMDINMPDMDGITATEQLSATAPGAAVVMMSVQGEADYLRRSMLAGAREFLVKPFSSDELTASIRQVSARERDKQSRMAVAPVAAGSASGGDALVGRRSPRARPRRRGVQPERRRRTDDRRGQPGRRRRYRARQDAS